MIYVEMSVFEFAAKYQLPLEPRFCSCGEVMKMRPIRTKGYAGFEYSCECDVKVTQQLLVAVTEEAINHWKGIFNDGIEQR